MYICDVFNIYHYDDLSHEVKTTIYRCSDMSFNSYIFLHKTIVFVYLNNNNIIHS